MKLQIERIYIFIAISVALCRNDNNNSNNNTNNLNRIFFITAFLNQQYYTDSLSTARVNFNINTKGNGHIKLSSSSSALFALWSTQTDMTTDDDNGASTPPPLDTLPNTTTALDEAIDLSYESAAQVQLLEQRVHMLQNELSLKDVQLENTVSTWSKQFDDIQIDKKTLQTDVITLQQQLSDLQSLREQELKAFNREMFDCIEHTDVSAWYVEKEHEEEKKELLRKIDESKKQLESMRIKFQKEEYKVKLQQEQSRVQSASNNISLQRKSFTDEKFTLVQQADKYELCINDLMTNLNAAQDEIWTVQHLSKSLENLVIKANVEKEIAIQQRKEIDTVHTIQVHELQAKITELEDTINKQSIELQYIQYVLVSVLRLLTKYNYQKEL